MEATFTPDANKDRPCCRLFLAAFAPLLDFLTGLFSITQGKHLLLVCFTLPPEKHTTTPRLFTAMPTISGDPHALEPGASRLRISGFEMNNLLGDISYCLFLCV